MADLQVSGAEQFVRLSKALKHAGETELRKELNNGIRKAVRPSLPKAQQRLAAVMPTGELRRRAGGVKQGISVRTGANPGVSVRVTYGKRGAGLHGSNARLLNVKGQVRHPVPNADRDDKRTWRNTAVPGARGWFDETYTDSAPAVRRGIEQAISGVAEQIARRTA